MRAKDSMRLHWIANATEYGLATSVWMRDIDRGARVAAAIDATTFWSNDWAVVHDQFEEGGFKQSEIGRLNGCAAIDSFVEIKHVVHNPRMSESAQS